MSTPDFSKVFGTNAQSTQDWQDNNYQTGWGFLGQELPPYQLFDYLQKQNDIKAKWLYDNLAANYIRQSNNAYAVGDVSYSPSLPSRAYLECITAGTTGATEPIWTDVGTTVTDGTVVWIIRDKRQVPDYTSGIDLSAISGTKIPNLGFILGLLGNLANGTAVTWDGDNFSCPALDIHGLMAQNGYISFGKLFGGFILQWGTETITNSSGIIVSLPISYQDAGYKAFTSHNNGTDATSIVPLSVGYINATYFYVSNNINANPAFFWATWGR